MNFKNCKKCHTDLPIANFNKHRRKPDGLDIYCRDCQKKYRASKSLHNAEYAKWWRKDNPKKTYNHSKAWRLNNAEKNKECQEKWRKKNPRKYHPCSYNGNTLARRLSVLRRRKRMRSAAGCFTAKQWLEKCSYYGWRCIYCFGELTMETVTLEHCIPISLGGTNWPANLAPACLSCNSSQGAKSWSQKRRRSSRAYFLKRRGYCIKSVVGGFISMGKEPMLARTFFPRG